jgi:hypothetical protein
MRKRSRTEWDYSGITFVNSQDEPHLGGNVLEGDPYTFCPRVWSYVIERFAIGSVLDLGSGVGYSADFFHRKGLRTIAVDGLSDRIIEKSPFDGYLPERCRDKAPLTEFASGCAEVRRNFARAARECCRAA